MKKLIALLFVMMSVKTFSQLNITPMPAEVKMGKGNFTINRNTVIVLEGSGLEKTVDIFNGELQKMLGFKLKIVKVNPGKNTITLNFEKLDYKFPGAYNLTVDEKGIYIAGDNETGVFYGLQTLIQLLPPVSGKQLFQTADASRLNDIRYPAPTIPYLFINDYPRFEYRGVHFDVSRHFFPVNYVKKYIDYLAAHKFNTFHWHLTDDQGWRIEIKKYPKLTSVGAWRSGTIIGRFPGSGNDSIRYGGFYTQEQIREIVKYAGDRYITVLPEIDIPGHSMAALAAYPELGTDSTYPYKVAETWGINGPFNNVLNPTEKTFKFLEDVFDEVIKLFPSKYIHVGGDECSKTWWKQSAFCQQLIKDKNLKDEHGLQSYIIQRVEKYINSKGRKIIGWDEILEGGLAPNASVMSWRGEEGGIAAAKQGHDVVMTPGTYCYFDHSQTRNEDSVTIGSYLPLETVYSYEPIPAALTAAEAKHILGAQANLWTEYISNPAKVEYMLFPRMSALSEVLWTPKDKRNWNDFERRIPFLMQRYESWAANYSKAYYDLDATVSAAQDGNGLVWQVKRKPNGSQGMDVLFADGNSAIALPAYDADGKISTAVIPEKFEVKERARADQNSVSLNVTASGTARAALYNSTNQTGMELVMDEQHPVTVLTQKFSFNKATGKKITLKKEAAKNYPGNGAFTLVDGIQNTKGAGRSSEFLGFLGDCEATIDFGKTTVFDKVVIHALSQHSSWIWEPSRMEVSLSEDGVNFVPVGIGEEFIRVNTGNGTITMNMANSSARVIKVGVKNFGKIPEGNPGAGTVSWLFVDEIEVK
ncbi:MAG: family 20 glycosylhydrolase [Ferruginibacter sp.]